MILDFCQETGHFPAALKSITTLDKTIDITPREQMYTQGAERKAAIQDPAMRLPDKGETFSLTEGEISLLVAETRPSVTGSNDGIVFSEDYFYYPFNNDFGPHNLSSVLRFCADVCNLFSSNEHVLVHSKSSPRQVTNAAFLIGAYLVIEQRIPAQHVWAFFQKFEKLHFEDYLDASQSQEPAQFTLSLLDCLLGIEMALNCGFLDHMTPPNNRAFSLDLYEQLDDPRNGDVQFLVPGRLLSFKQPSAAPGADAEAGLRGWWDDDNGIRQFSAPFFARKLEALGATTLLRLADAGYDRAPFEEHGVAVRDLDFHGMSTPPAYTAVQFLLACDEAPGGAVALQCRSGLGRSATLAGLWLMREHRFSAREAIAWLRVMKPGSVLGEQQHYLEDMQPSMWRLHDAGRDKAHAALLKAAGRAAAGQ
eukprot:CAMPEP_0113704758 /NCGR_PEP_ID=MMETSP0038_2-20120614/26713_1 /TAXON_ID=2898 /ORGANISM="Cryptomonas paramecium" /LENGTH=421 /DNA_ID=CAMNT_0000629607 /DNA_START=92 /DNA_END=1357 /DNA_ORIENTATION=+ /assembly_acc=CAM_ASM_000170